MDSEEVVLEVVRLAFHLQIVSLLQHLLYVGFERRRQKFRLLCVGETALGTVPDQSFLTAKLLILLFGKLNTRGMEPGFALVTLNLFPITSMAVAYALNVV